MRIPILLAVVLLSSCQKDLMQVIVDLPYAVNKASTPQKDLTALVFLDIDCPISQYVIKPMNSIQLNHQEKLQIIGLLPGEYYSNQEKIDFIANFSVKFELKDDPKLRAVKRLDATVTPQCFLIGQHGNVLYKGALDNKYEALGRAKPIPSVNYLVLAINQALTGKQVEVSNTKPIGCLIER
jgi:hypothetical protein